MNTKQKAIQEITQVLSNYGFTISEAKEILHAVVNHLNKQKVVSKQTINYELKLPETVDGKEFINELCRKIDEQYSIAKKI